MKVVMIDSLVGNDYSLCLCASLKSAGVDICLVVTEDRDESLLAPIRLSVKKWSPSKNSAYGKWRKAFKYLQYLAKTAWYAISESVEVVHFQFFRLERIECLYYLLLRVMGINLAYTAHDVFPNERKKLDFFFKYLVYRASKVIFVHSEHIKKMLVDNFGVSGKKIEIVPHGNFDHYLPQHEITKHTARKELGLSEKDQVLLFFGNIREYKGLDLLLDAFEMASQENKLLKLVIAGLPLTQELKERYAQKIRFLSAKERIIYHAEFIPSEKVAGYFVACDVVALPYQNIYHSGVLHLAYSFAKPVIATKVGDFPETIEHGRSGYLLEVNDATCLANAIAELFAEPDTLLEMGRYARELSEIKYSWEAIARKTRRVYSLIADSR